MEQHFLDILEIECLDNMVYQCFTTGGSVFLPVSKFSFITKKPKKKKAKKMSSNGLEPMVGRSMYTILINLAAVIINQIAYKQGF